MGEYLTRLLRNVEYQIKFLDGLISENHHFTSIRPSITNVSMGWGLNSLSSIITRLMKIIDMVIEV